MKLLSAKYKNDIIFTVFRALTLVFVLGELAEAIERCLNS